MITALSAVGIRYRLGNQPCFAVVALKIIEYSQTSEPSRMSRVSGTRFNMLEPPHCSASPHSVVPLMRRRPSRPTVRHLPSLRRRMPTSHAQRTVAGVQADGAQCLQRCQREARRYNELIRIRMQGQRRGHWRRRVPRPKRTRHRRFDGQAQVQGRGRSHQRDDHEQNDPGKRDRRRNHDGTGRNHHGSGPDHHCQGQRLDPDHAVMSATKDRLKALQQFKYFDYN
jgi:hypothetical protein